jgi:hypothetical protein
MAKKKKTARKKTKRRGRPPGVAGMSIAQLEAAIARRKAAEAKQLEVKRNKLARQVAALDREIAELRGGVTRRRKKKVVRKKRGRKKAAKKVVRKGAKKKARKAAKKKAKRLRSSPAQIERVQASILKALKGKKNGLLKNDLTKAVRGRTQTFNTALKKLIAAKRVKTKGITRNMRYIAA